MPQFPNTRMRRTRAHDWSRRMVQERTIKPARAEELLEELKVVQVGA